LRDLGLLIFIKLPTRKTAKKTAAKAERMRGADRRGTQGCDAPVRSFAPSGARVFPAASWNTPTEGRARGAPFGKFNGVVWTGLQEMTFTSCGAANYMRRRGSLRKNIIGHGMPVRWKQFLALGGCGVAWRPLALLDQPTSEHGAGIFFQPLIKQCANFLAEVGGVSKTRKLIALERVTRSREKEFPRRLRWGTRHVGLQDGRMEGNR